MICNNQKKPKVAVLITGTYREIEFILKIFPYLAGEIDYDIFLVLRHVRVNELSRLGTEEQDFQIAQLMHLPDRQIFFCELPSIDITVATSRYLVPVGPESIDRECGMLSMFQGVLTAISMMKSSLRPYTHIMKTRTDYLPWVTPWITELLKLYERSGQKIIVDGLVTKPLRYPDRKDILWQGSISDLFCFASTNQFLTLWDIEGILSKVWTGIGETTLFRAAMLRFLGDEIQSKRRNDSFLNKYFIWEPNDTKQSYNFLRAGVLNDKIKERVLDLLKCQKLPLDLVNKLIRTTYDYIIDRSNNVEFEEVVGTCFAGEQRKEFIQECFDALSHTKQI